MTAPDARWLTRRDILLLIAFCGVLFGCSLVGGRVLSLHEARLPQAAREMLANGHWLVPTCGGRPWLERPPLPHWITMGVAALCGGADRVWVVRLPSVMMGTLTALCLAYIAAGWHGRRMGLFSGLILATTFEFTRYAWLAEEDIYLAAIVSILIALFIHLERNTFSNSSLIPHPTSLPPILHPPSSILHLPPYGVMVFFALLGLSNLVKGLCFAALLVGATVGAYILWCRDGRLARRYLSPWGWLLAGVLAAAWPVAVSFYYPDMLDIWFGDVANRTDGESRVSPVWYYWLNLSWLLLPWSIPAVVGLWLTRQAAWNERGWERFVWCWALAPIAFLSLPAHKHHHYLVPCLAPWAILAAVGSRCIWESILAAPRWFRSPWLAVAGIGVPAAVALILLESRIPGPPAWTWGFALAVPLALLALNRALNSRNATIAAGGCCSVIAAAYLAAHVYSGQYLDKYRDDTQFLVRIQETLPAGEPVFVNADGAVLNPFRQLFYLGSSGRTLHNLTFLQDAALDRSTVYVLARQRAQQELAAYGTAEALDSGPAIQRRDPADMRWTLFRVQLRNDLPHYENTSRISALQSMGREPGPWLGLH